METLQIILLIVMLLLACAAAGYILVTVLRAMWHLARNREWRFFGISISFSVGLLLEIILAIVGLEEQFPWADNLSFIALGIYIIMLILAWLLGPPLEEPEAARRERAERPPEPRRPTPPRPEAKLALGELAFVVETRIEGGRLRREIPQSNRVSLKATRVWPVAEIWVNTQRLEGQTGQVTFRIGLPQSPGRPRKFARTVTVTLEHGMNRVVATEAIEIAENHRLRRGEGSITLEISFWGEDTSVPLGQVSFRLVEPLPDIDLADEEGIIQARAGRRFEEDVTPPDLEALLDE